MEDLQDRTPKLYKRLKKMPQEQLMRDYFKNKFCIADGEYRPDWCIEKQTRFLGLIKPADGYYFNDEGLKNVTYQATLPTAAQIETELAKLSAFGIVEALDVSVCLIIYKTQAGGSLGLFKSRCGKGVTSNKRTGGHNNERDESKQHEDNRSSKSAELYNKIRQNNLSMVKLIEFSHRSDSVLYNVAANKFIRDVRAMSKETGIRFDIPPSVLAAARPLLLIATSRG
jgi:hypothetical protein